MRDEYWECKKHNAVGNTYGCPECNKLCELCGEHPDDCECTEEEKENY